MSDESVDINYKATFNQGYWLKLGDPKLFDQFVSSLKNKENSAYRGYIDGGRQAERDKLKQQLTDARNKGRSR